MESGGFGALRKLSAMVTVMHGFSGAVKWGLITTNYKDSVAFFAGRGANQRRGFSSCGAPEPEHSRAICQGMRRFPCKNCRAKARDKYRAAAG